MPPFLVQDAHHFWNIQYCKYKRTGTSKRKGTTNTWRITSACLPEVIPSIDKPLDAIKRSNRALKRFPLRPRVIKSAFFSSSFPYHSMITASISQSYVTQAGCNVFGRIVEHGANRTFLEYLNNNRKKTKVLRTEDWWLWRVPSECSLKSNKSIWAAVTSPAIQHAPFAYRDNSSARAYRFHARSRCVLVGFRNRFTQRATQQAATVIISHLVRN